MIKTRNLLCGLTIPCTFLSLFLSCQEPRPVSSDGHIHIPFAQTIDGKAEKSAFLSDYADDVEYIWLETSDNSLLKDIVNQHIAITEKYVILYNKHAVFQFGRDGKFIRRVGRKGQGPGEYLQVIHMDVTPNEKEIFVLTLDDAWIMYVYDAETGEFKYRFKVASQFSIDFMMYNDSTTVSFDKSWQQGGSRITIGTLSGQIIKRFYDPKIDKNLTRTGAVVMSPFHRHLYRFDNEIKYKEYYNDTIFNIYTDSLVPRYIVDLGEYALPMDKRPEFCRQPLREIGEPYLLYEVIESDRYIFLPYFSWKNDWDHTQRKQLLVYDKEEAVSYKVKGDYIENDFSGGIPFQPISTTKDNAPYCVWDCEKLIELGEENPDIQELLEENKIDFDSNPMIMIVHTHK